MGWQEREEAVGRLEILPQAPTVRCRTRLFRRRRGAAVSRQNTSCTFSEKSISAMLLQLGGGHRAGCGDAQKNIPQPYPKRQAAFFLLDSKKPIIVD